MTDVEPKSNYKQFFIFGILLLVAGIGLTIILKNATAFVLYGTGISYLILGLVRRKKWKASQKPGRLNEEV